MIESECIQWWVDVSFVIHANMRGHTGATMSMASRSLFRGSWKQKLVTCSSTESEMVGVYDTLPPVLWTKKFLKEQDVHIKETMAYQDNMSSTLMENDGKQSRTKHTRHMDIHYFYVMDHVKNKDITIHHCPTEDMITNYFMKPLQGSLFVKLWNYIMGGEYGDIPHTHRSVLD